MDDYAGQDMGPKRPEMLAEERLDVCVEQMRTIDAQVKELLERRAKLSEEINEAASAIARKTDTAVDLAAHPPFKWTDKIERAEEDLKQARAGDHRVMGSPRGGQHH